MQRYIVRYQKDGCAPELRASCPTALEACEYVLRTWPDHDTWHTGDPLGEEGEAAAIGWCTVGDNQLAWIEKVQS